MMQRFLPGLAPVALAALVGGCASGVQNPSGVPVTVLKADEQGFITGSGIESQDLVAITDRMARSLLSNSEIRDFQPAPPRVVLLPVENDTRFPINKDLFTTRIRALLNSQANGRIRFLARDRMTALEQERALKQEGKVTANADPFLQEFKGADFFLTGRLQGLSTQARGGVSDYVLYTFQLIDPRTSEILWEDSAEVKKQSVEDAAYR
ncbi:MAG: penicillin-binding protein activator LpoB [Verrucomicrobiae bacterium]|nr:penicillin-binding protein activator LpoB [Verrucomicrobiae bacterium]